MVVKKTEVVEGTILDAEEPKHVLRLVLEDEEHPFDCKPDVKLGFLVRMADNGLGGLKAIIERCYDGDDVSEVFEVTDEMDLEDIGEAVAELIESYTKDRTGPRSSSRGGSSRTRRR